MLHLTETERAELVARARHGRGSAGVARRARVVLLLAGGKTYAEIEAAAGISRRTIALWKKRFENQRLEGLFDKRVRRG